MSGIIRPATTTPGAAAKAEPHALVERTAELILDYIALPLTTALVIANWIIAAWLVNSWERFPHLAVSSPERRCGKSTLLELLALLVPNPLATSSISPAALYRTIQAQRKTPPTILLDEAQSLNRRGSEGGEALRELLNAGIAKSSKVVRCVPPTFKKVESFSVYSPKVFALIGEPDGVLADRCLPVTMRRKTTDDVVQRFHTRVVEPRAADLRAEIEAWANEMSEVASDLYLVVEPFDIANDRMAELLLPLQCVLQLMGADEAIEKELRSYAAALDERDREQDSQSWGVRLLTACRELLDGHLFLPTEALLAGLHARDEEPWHRWNKGMGLTAESLAKMLRPYGVRPQPDRKRQQRGYHAADFAEPWSRYLGPASGRAGQALKANPSRGAARH